MLGIVISLGVEGPASAFVESSASMVDVPSCDCDVAVIVVRALGRIGHELSKFMSVPQSVLVFGSGR